MLNDFKYKPQQVENELNTKLFRLGNQNVARRELFTMLFLTLSEFQLSNEGIFKGSVL